MTASHNPEVRMLTSASNLTALMEGPALMLPTRSFENTKTIIKYKICPDTM